MNTLVEAGVVGGFLTVVRECSHEPQAVTLEHSVKDTVENVEEHWADVCTVLEVHCCNFDGAVCVCSDVGSGETLLKFVTSTPDGHGNAEKKSPSDSGTNTSPEPLEVQDGTHDNGTKHLEEPVKQGVQGSGSDVKTASVELVELVCVEPVGGKEHREHDEDFWLFNQQLEGAQNLRLPVRERLVDDSGAVVSPDFFLWQHEEGDDTTAAHKDHESDVGAVLDGGGVGVHVVGQGDDCTDDGAEVEDDPEDHDSPALFLFSWVGHDDGALGSPEAGAAETEICAGKDDEAGVLVVVVAQKRACVDEVARSAKHQAVAWAHQVAEGSGKEAETGKGTVESDGGVVLRLDSVGSADGRPDTGQGVVHARRHEHDEGKHHDLDRRVRVGRQEGHVSLVVELAAALDLAGGVVFHLLQRRGAGSAGILLEGLVERVRRALAHVHLEGGRLFLFRHGAAGYI